MTPQSPEQVLPIEHTTLMTYRVDYRIPEHPDYRDWTPWVLAEDREDADAVVARDAVRFEYMAFRIVRTVVTTERRVLEEFAPRFRDAKEAAR